MEKTEHTRNNIFSIDDFLKKETGTENTECTKHFIRTTKLISYYRKSQGDDTI